MAMSLKQQFIDLQNFNNNNTQQGEGVLLASISVTGHVVAKQEYITYIQRYGPPINGIFDIIYLELIRAEIAAGAVP